MEIGTVHMGVMSLFHINVGKIGGAQVFLNVENLLCVHMSVSYVMTILIALKVMMKSFALWNQSAAQLCVNVWLLLFCVWTSLLQPRILKLFVILK